MTVSDFWGVATSASGGIELFMTKAASAVRIIVRPYIRKWIASLDEKFSEQWRQEVLERPETFWRFSSCDLNLEGIFNGLVKQEVERFLKTRSPK